MIVEEIPARGWSAKYVCDEFGNEVWQLTITFKTREEVWGIASLVRSYSAEETDVVVVEDGFIDLSGDGL